MIVSLTRKLCAFDPSPNPSSDGFVALSGIEHIFQKVSSNKFEHLLMRRWMWCQNIRMFSWPGSTAWLCAYTMFICKVPHKNRKVEKPIFAGALQMLTQQAKDGEKQSARRTRFPEMCGCMVFSIGIGTKEELILHSPLLRVEGGVN